MAKNHADINRTFSKDFKGLELPGFSCGALQQAKLILIYNTSKGLPTDFLHSQLIPNRCKIGQICFSRYKIAASSHFVNNRETTARTRTIEQAQINMHLWRL